MNPRTVATLLVFVACVSLLSLISRQQLMNIRFVRTVFSEPEENISFPLFKVKPLVMWSIDYHSTPTYDLRHFLQPMGIKFFYTNFDNYGPRCAAKNNCHATMKLKAFDPATAIHLQTHQIKPFYDAYKNDPEMMSVDAYVCFHAVALCELYEPFNKSIIIIATLRYEYGRFGKERWTAWNRNLLKYASQPWNVVAANNLYDAEYIKYFTGIQPLLLPSWCNYTNQTYSPSRPGFLMTSSHYQPFHDLFYNNFTAVCRKLNCTANLSPLRRRYRYYNYIDVAAHQGMVIVPYQVSVMSFFENYRMGIPMFAPTKELLVQWEIKYNMMTFKRWNHFDVVKYNRSSIDSHPSQSSIPDPNSYTEEAYRYWGKFCDFYQYPHITYYDSIEDLIRILQSVTKEQLMNISEKMKRYNIKENVRLMKLWKDILMKIAYYSKNHPY